ncbi:MAG: hypothetical protein IJS73_06720 [Paludibacteraceae bacterium]|nr:hypothetical protein [Paludibacteraceae bacterium]
MKKTIIYIIVLLLMLPTGVFAKKKTKEKSQEEITLEQRFNYYFYEAERAYSTARYDYAYALWTMLAQMNPTNATVQHYLGVLHAGLSLDSLAFIDFERAFQLDKENYWETYISYLADRKMTDKACQELEKLVKDYPDNIEMRETLVKFQLSVPKKKASTLKHIEYIEKKNGLNRDVLGLYYYLYANSNEYEKVLEVIDRFLHLEPDNEQIVSFKGDFLASIGRMEESNQWCIEQYEKNPQNYFLALTLADNYITEGDSVKARGYLYEAIENEEMYLDDKIQIINKHDDLLQTDSIAYNEMLSTLYSDHPQEEQIYKMRVQKALRNNDIETAKKEQRNLILLNPEESNYWEQLLSIYQLDSISFINDTAENIFREAFVHLPEHPLWVYRYCLTLATHDSIAEALEYANKIAVLETDKQADMVNLWVFIGDLYTNDKVAQYDSAFFWYEKSLKIFPKSSYIKNNYAYMLAIHPPQDIPLSETLRKAEAMSRETIQEEPTNYMYLDTYAWILHLQGDDTLALFYMKKALQYFPQGQERKEEYIEHYEAIEQHKQQQQ